MKQDSDVSKRVVWYGLSISMHSPGYILICSHHEPEEFCFALVQVRCCLCAKIHLQWCGQYGISIIRRNKATHIHRNIYGNVNMCNICIMWMNGTHRNAFQNNSPVFLYISYCSSKPFNVKIKICSHIVITISNRRVCYVMETRLQWEPRWSIREHSDWVIHRESPQAFCFSLLHSVHCWNALKFVWLVDSGPTVVTARDG